MTDIDNLISKMRAGLQGVTPGPWRHYNAPLRPGFRSRINEVQPARGGEPIVQWAGFDNSDVSKAQHKSNAAHIARCSPENIAALLDEIERLRTLLFGGGEPVAMRGIAEEAANFQRDWAVAARERDEARAEIERLHVLVAKLSSPDMYWDSDDPEYPDYGSFDHAQDNPGNVVEYDCARRLPPIYVVTLPEDDENEKPLWEEWFFSGDTREAAETALAAERVRRARAALEERK